MSAAQTPKGLVLNSWKEIAAYLGRGVRTVQRYERDLGLPVRRPRGKSRSAVIALADELDNWLRNAPKQESAPHPELRKPVLSVRIRETIESSTDLRSRSNELRLAHRQAMDALVANLKLTVANLNATMLVINGNGNDNGNGNGNSNAGGGRLSQAHLQ
jgi:hypothetical protein